MNKITKYINAECIKHITSELLIMDCEHKWEKHGFGYQCRGCGYYTGTNDILNKEIEKEQK